jgi:hypothetical protein
MISHTTGHERRPSDAVRSGSRIACPETTLEQREHRWDAVETYFTCLTTCSLHDRSCAERCVEDLRQVS